MNKWELVEAAKDLNKRDIFNEEIPLHETVPNLKKYLREAALLLTTEDEIFQETAEILLDIIKKTVYTGGIRRLPRKINGYPSKYDEVDIITSFKIEPDKNPEYRILPINPIWFWNRVKWERRNANSIRFNELSEHLIFPAITTHGISFHERVSSSLLYTTPNNDIEIAIGEFITYIKTLKDPNSFVEKIKRKRAQLRHPFFKKNFKKWVYMKTRDKNGDPVWKILSNCNFIEMPPGWRDISIYTAHLDDRYPEIGGAALIEPLSGDILYADANRTQAAIRGRQFLITSETPEGFRQRVTDSIKRDGGSPYYPCIYKFEPLGVHFEGNIPVRCPKGKTFEGEIAKEMTKNFHIKPSEMIDILYKKGFRNMKNLSIRQRMHHTRHTITALKGVKHDKP